MTRDRRTSGAWTLNLLFGGLFLTLAALAGRLAWMVYEHAPDARSRADRQYRRVIPVPARPGSIYARTRGTWVLLAGSRQVPSCYADPALLDEAGIGDTSIQVGRILGVNPLDIQYKLLTRHDRRFAWLAREITPEQAQAIRDLNNPAVAITQEWRREYPNGPLAATVLGWRRIDGVAAAGVELSQDPALRAVDGQRVVLTDARRRAIWPVPEELRTPQDGQSVFLTIDAVIQAHLADALSRTVQEHGDENTWATGVVIRPRTGEVLAIASVPSFDPNQFNAPGSSWHNRAISMPYEPGSVAKPLFSAAAVDAGIARWQEEFFCENGSYRAHRGGRITDHGHRYGNLTLVDVNVHSSNIGMAKLGEKLGNDMLHEIAMRYGFGEPTGLPLPAESGGIVRPLNRWDGYSLRRVPFGQEISTTAIQLAMAFGALANGGNLMEPILVQQVTDADGRVVRRAQPRVVRRVLRPQSASQAVEVMRQVVERGTGKACRMDAWSSFGKTGTAQVAGEGGYLEGAYTGSFIGGAPASRPEVICLISVYRPDRSKGYYGSKVAAPYVKQVLESTLGYLNVPADQGPAVADGRR